MTFETDTDRDIYLSDFGETVTVGGGPNTFLGLFENKYIESLGIDATAPTVTCKSSDVTTYSLARGTALAVLSVNYTVAVIEPVEPGWTDLILETV